MCGFQLCTIFHLKLILNLQDLLQSHNLETVPIGIVVLNFPRDNTFPPETDAVSFCFGVLISLCSYSFGAGRIFFFKGFTVS